MNCLTPHPVGFVGRLSSHADVPAARMAAIVSVWRIDRARRTTDALVVETEVAPMTRTLLNRDSDTPPMGASSARAAGDRTEACLIEKGAPRDVQAPAICVLVIFVAPDVEERDEALLSVRRKLERERAHHDVARVVSGMPYVCFVCCAVWHRSEVVEDLVYQPHSHDLAQTVNRDQALDVGALADRQIDTRHVPRPCALSTWDRTGGMWAPAAEEHRVDLCCVAESSAGDIRSHSIAFTNAHAHVLRIGSVRSQERDVDFPQKSVESNTPGTAGLIDKPVPSPPHRTGDRAVGIKPPIDAIDR